MSLNTFLVALAVTMGLNLRLQALKISLQAPTLSLLAVRR
jgi:hypothetical protein